MSKRRAWQEGYTAGREDTLGALRGGIPISRENPYDFMCDSCGCDLRYPTAPHVVDCANKEDGE